MKRWFLVFALLILALITPNRAWSQSSFYNCAIVIPNPPATQFATPAASPTICNLDPQRIVSGAGVGLILNFSPGAVATVSVQVTGDQNPAGATAAWNNHDYMFNLTSSMNGNIIMPLTAVRLYLTRYTSGTITLYLVEAAK
jgi:hypothetical protein